MRAKATLALTAAMAALVMGGPNARAALYTGGPGAAYAAGAMTNDVYFGSGITISSASNQVLARGSAPMAISTITIAESATTPIISNGTPIAVLIPSSFIMTWDAMDTTPTFGGTASTKVNPTVSYAGSNQRLMISVTNDFAVNDTLTISALAFTNYICSGITRLELDADNDGIADAQDDKTITILFTSYGGLGDSYAFDQVIRDKTLHTISGTFLRTE